MDNYLKYKKLTDEQGHLNEEGTAFYAEAMIAGRMEQLPGALRDHVESCSGCALQCLDMVMIMNELPAIIDDELPGDAGQDPPLAREPEAAYGRRLSRFSLFARDWKKLAAVIVLIVGVGSMYIIWRNVMRDEREVWAGQRDDLPGPLEAMPEKDITMLWVRGLTLKYPGAVGSYQLSELMEAMMKLSFRSSAFQVSAPAMNSTYSVKDTVYFQWKGEVAAEKCLRVFNNRGDTLHRRKLDHRDGYFLPKQLSPGLYYWFIDLNGIQAAGGRFAVRQD